MPTSKSKNLVFTRTNTTDAKPFDGEGKTILDVWSIDNGDWPVGAELVLLWRSPLTDLEPEIWRPVDGATWTAAGAKRLFLVPRAEYRLTSDIAGIQCYKWVINERVVNTLQKGE